MGDVLSGLATAGCPAAARVPDRARSGSPSASSACSPMAGLPRGNPGRSAPEDNCRPRSRLRIPAPRSDPRWHRLDKPADCRNRGDRYTANDRHCGKESEARGRFFAATRRDDPPTPCVAIRLERWGSTGASGCRRKSLCRAVRVKRVSLHGGGLRHCAVDQPAAGPALRRQRHAGARCGRRGGKEHSTPAHMASSSDSLPAESAVRANSVILTADRIQNSWQTSRSAVHTVAASDVWFMALAATQANGHRQVDHAAVTVAKDAKTASDGDTPSVLIVADDARRREEIVLVLLRFAPECRLSSLADPIDALILSAGARIDLAVLDASLALAAAPVLERQLARVAPEAAVLVFDLADGSSTVPGTLDWIDAYAACAGWIAARRARMRARSMTTRRPGA